MKEIQIKLNGTSYSFEQLSSGGGGQPRTEFEKSTLTFCREWIRGQASFVLSTSGSTGTPKLITLRREQMEASALLTSAALNLQSGFKALICLDTRSIAGQMMLVRSFVTGMDVMAIEPSANPFGSIPANERIDFTALVPYQLQKIINSGTVKKRLNRLKAVLVGGAPVSSDVKAALKELSCPIYATYGMTETLSHIALQRLNGPEAHDHFHVLPGIAIDTDARGCLIITADYLGKEPIVTNDLVRIHGRSQFEWLGRLDRVINSGGIKVSAEKVEIESGKVLHSMGLANRCFVAGLPDETLGARVVLVIEGSPFPESQQLDFYKRLEPVLGKYEVPKEIRFSPRFAETATQKVDRVATLRISNGIR